MGIGVDRGARYVPMFSKLGQLDLDTVLGFRTKKMVLIRDRYLGAVYYSFFITILIYIVGYVVLWKQGYLRSESILGTTSVLLKNPASFAKITYDKPYCKPPHQCQLWDEHDVRYPNRKLLRHALLRCAALQAPCC